jgi:hypothetical protein
MTVGKATSILLALFSCVSWLLATDKPPQSPRFSRPTIKGTAVGEAPARYRTVYKDHQYEFAVSDKLAGEVESSAFFAHDLVGQRWVRVTELSTENARLGKSFDGKTADDSDLRALANSDYARIPIKVRGSKLLPDRITFDRNNQLYRFDFNYQLNLSITLSYFWVSKTDLDAVR